MTRLLAEITAIESPSSDPAGVEAVARRIEQELGELGLPGELVPVDGAGPILRVRRGERPVMLLGHLDTVWDLGNARAAAGAHRGGPPLRPRLLRHEGRSRGHRLRTEGASRARRDSAGLRVPDAPRRSRRRELPRRLESEMRACRAVLDFEPAWPGGAVKTRRKGLATFTLRARGVAAHAGADFARGANAILELALRLLDAAALTDLDRGVTVNVGTVRGGSRPNVVPDLAEAQLDIRFRSLADGEIARAALEALRSSDPRVSLELEASALLPAARARAPRRGSLPRRTRGGGRPRPAPARRGRDRRRLGGLVRRRPRNPDARRPRRRRRRRARLRRARPSLLAPRTRRPRRRPPGVSPDSLKLGA